MQITAGPQLTVPRISLVTAAETITPAESRWFDTLDIEFEGLPSVQIFPTVCTNGEVVKLPRDMGSNDSYFPYELYAIDRCSTYQDRDRWGRVTRKLLSGESTGIEAQLFSDPDSFGNPNLVSEAADLAGAAVSAVHALAELEQALATVGNTRGMIHIRPGILTLLVADDALHREGNVYYTAMDNIVVPGRGYLGTGPAGQAISTTSEWMYASTGVVVVRRSEIRYSPEMADPEYMRVDRAINDIEVRAERVALAALDTSGSVFAKQVNPSL